MYIFVSPGLAAALQSSSQVITARSLPARDIQSDGAIERLAAHCSSDALIHSIFCNYLLSVGLHRHCQARLLYVWQHSSMQNSLTIAA